MIDKLQEFLAAISPGSITDTNDLTRILADVWNQFTGDGGGMEGRKLLGRMEKVAWNPPLLTFTIERHDGTVLGSTGATLQEWNVDVEKKAVMCIEARRRQLSPIEPGLDLGPIAEEIASHIVNRRQDDRLRWYADDRVRVLVGKVLPEGSVVKQALTARRKRLRAAVRERLEIEGWGEISVHVYQRWPTTHKQVRVKVGYFEADIDEELAPLIEELWKADLATVLSCQENLPGIAWIVFLMPDDLSSFLNIVARYEPEDGSLYLRIYGQSEEGRWEYDLFPRDDALHEGQDGNGEWHEGQACFDFNASVRFPRTDLPVLLNRMVRHNVSLSKGEDEFDDDEFDDEEFDDEEFDDDEFDDES